MANVRKKISELTALSSASLDTTIVGVDNGTTYKIELDTLADAVTSRVNILDRNRLSSLESVTSSFETKGRSVISSSAQITNLGFVSTSVDITSLNSFTASQSTLNTAFTNGISARLQTSSFNDFSASVNQRILDATNEQSFNGLISGSSQLTSSYDIRYVLSGSITQTTWDNIASKPSGIYSSSAQIQGNIYSAGSSFTFQDLLLGAGTTFGKITTDGTKYISVMPTYNVESTRFWPNGNVTIQDGGDYVDNGFRLEVSGSTRIVGSFNVIGGITGSTNFDTIVNKPTIISGSSQLTSSFDTRYTLSGSISATPAGTISGSSQLTSSFDSRYVLESETGSLQTSITNLNSFTQSFSTSVDSRFDTLEATIISGSPNYTQVLGNRRTSITSTGVSIISGSITTTGNPVQIMVTGDANPVNVTSWTRLQIYRDENAIGGIVQVENSSNLNVPYCVNVIDTPPAGTYSYSMRTVSGFSGLFDFGESTGPVLTAVELKTNTNLPSTNNTFTGTNRFNGQVTLGGAGGDEGGELQLATAQTNSTLTAGVVSVDVYRDRLRIFEGGGNARGVYVDLSKAPAGNAGELMWKASGMVAAGTFVTLDNLKCTVTTSSNRGLSIAAVSTTFEADLSGWYAASVGSAGGSTNNISYTTTASTSLFNWNFAAHGDTAHYHIRDKTNDRFYRVTMMIGIGYNSNFISIERLF
jgi:hypothetical protein